MNGAAPGHIELTSAGGVVHRRRGGGAEFVLIRVGEDRWQLPKGLVDDGEAPEETALREVREETGLTCRILSPLPTIDYWFNAAYDGPSTRYHKYVHFFLMEFVSGDTSDHDDEVSEARWLDEEAAMRMLAFDSEKKVLLEALERMRTEAA